MARDKRSELLESIESIKEAMSRNNGNYDIEREIEETVEQAFKEGRIPAECIEEHEVSKDMVARVVVFKEV